MSYSGSTAASPNPPRLLVPAMSGPLPVSSTSIYRRGAQLWSYNTSDGTTLLQNAAYFTDGKNLGFQLGDMLIGLSATTESSTGHIVFQGALVTTNSTAGWNLSTGGTITSTFS